MDPLTKQSEDTARMDTHEVVGYLLDQLGPTLTAYMANTRSRAMPARWAAPPGAPNHAAPADETLTRLQSAHAVLRMIEDSDSEQVARNWLIAANPELDEHTPASFIRQDRIQDVYRAAVAFVGDTYYS